MSWKPEEKRKNRRQERWWARFLRRGTWNFEFCGSVVIASAALDCNYYLQWHYTFKGTSKYTFWNQRSQGKSTHWHMVQVWGSAQKLDCLVSILAVPFILLLCLFYFLYGETEGTCMQIFVWESFIIPPSERHYEIKAYNSTKDFLSCFFFPFALKCNALRFYLF